MTTGLRWYWIASAVLLALVMAAGKGIRTAIGSRPPAGAHAGAIGRVDEVLVDKRDRRLYLKRGGEVLAQFRVALGFAPLGHKAEEGDGRTPEGRYVLDWRNPHSRFHRSLHVSYPNAADAAQAAARGVSPGGDIFIHGTPWWLAALERDWTLGCIAVQNAEMDMIWTAIADGTPITIRP